ncbi:MAG: YggT family protein [Robiginitomaculum sp.]
MTLALLGLFNNLIGLYIFIMVAMIIFSWLQAFNVINTRNPIVGQIGTVLYRLTEPVLAPIRKIIPSIGGLDLSPIVVFFGLQFIQTLVNKTVATGNPF